MKLLFEFVCNETLVVAECVLSTDDTHDEAEPPEPPDRTDPVPRLSSSPVLRCFRILCNNIEFLIN